MSQAIVHFRTVPNGSYRYTKKQRRGYWRVLVVESPEKSFSLTSKNVLEILYRGPEGLDGATEKSAYYIGNSYKLAQEIANEYNAAHP